MKTINKTIFNDYLTRFGTLIIVALFPIYSVWADVSPPLPRTIADVTGLLDRRVPDPKTVTGLRERLSAVVPTGANRGRLVEFHQGQAEAAAGLGLVTRVLEERRKLVALTEGERNQPKQLIDLAITEMTAGNWAIAEKLVRRVSTVPTGMWGQDIFAALLLARMQSWLGDITSAKTNTGQAESMFRRFASHQSAVQFRELVAAMFAWSNGDTQLTEGKTIVARGSLINAAEKAQSDAKLAERRSRSIEWAPALDSIWQLQDLIDAQLARVNAQQGYHAEAEQVARAMILRNLDRAGRDAPSTAVSLAVFGEVLIAQQRWREAAALGDMAAGILERAGAKVSSGYAFQAERVRIDSRLGIGDWKGATELIDTLRTGLGDETTMLRATERRGVWALALVRMGRSQEVSAWLSQLLIEQEHIYGRDRYETAETLGLHGVTLFALGKLDHAYEAFATAVPKLVSPSNNMDRQADNGLRQLARRAILEAWIGLLYELQGSDIAKAKGIDAAAEAFQIGDAIRGGTLQAAVSASAARAFAGTPQLGELIRREQDAKRELVTMNDRLGSLALTPDSDIREKSVREIQLKIQVLEAERIDLYRRIESQFPNYANLTNPRPASAADAAKALGSHEALVAILPTESRTFLWALAPKGELVFRAANLSAQELAGKVGRLREALDPGSMDFNRLQQFDYESAYQLYRDLLAPLEPVWGGAKEMVVITGGALGQIPVSLLPTKPVINLPRGAVQFEEMKQVPWLARRVAASSVPSANAFIQLRALPPGLQTRSAFVGFGDPLFESVADDGVKTRGVRLRNTAVQRVSTGVDIARTVVPWTKYGSLAPLPDTRDELQSIARVLGADMAKDLYLGADARRQTVLRSNLAQRRIIAFATHGLVPGDLPGLSQPALAMAGEKDPNESPLLTLEDVLGLKLDADWVVLSACNTAASDGAGGEAVSGLGRGFFYAGSRALLVTHWPVETVSARLLVTSVFDLYAKEPAATRSSTLQRAMISLIDGPGSVDSTGKTEFSYAHPIFWAPYALYGNGAR